MAILFSVYVFCDKSFHQNSDPRPRSLDGFCLLWALKSTSTLKIGVYIGIMETKMESTLMGYIGILGYILGKPWAQKHLLGGPWYL